MRVETAVGQRNQPQVFDDAYLLLVVAGLVDQRGELVVIVGLARFLFGEGEQVVELRRVEAELPLQGRSDSGPLLVGDAAAMRIISSRMAAVASCRACSRSVPVCPAPGSMSWLKKALMLEIIRIKSDCESASLMALVQPSLSSPA